MIIDDKTISEYLKRYSLQIAGQAVLTDDRLDTVFEGFNNIRNMRSDINSLTIADTAYDTNENGFYWPFGETNLQRLDIVGRNTTRLLLKSWEGIPSSIKDIHLHNVHVSTLKGIERMTSLRTLYFVGIQHSCLIDGGLLRLLKLPKLTKVQPLSPHDVKFQLALEIIETHLNTPDRDIVACQNELIDFGLDEYAKL